MRVSLEVNDRREAENVRRAWADPMVRAFVVIVGALLPLGDRARRRVLTYINDKVDEDAGRITIEGPMGGTVDAEAVVPLPRPEAR